VITCVRHIDGICKDSEHDETVAAILAAALAAASSVGSDNRMLELAAIDWEGRLRILRRSFPLNGEIVDSFASALMSKMIRLRHFETDAGSEEIAELCVLSDEYPERAHLAKVVAYSIRLFIRSGKELVPNEQVLTLVNVQWRLVSRFSESEHIAESLAKVAPFAIHALRLQRAKAPEFMECVGEIERRFPEDEAIREAVGQARAIYGFSGLSVEPS